MTQLQLDLGNDPDATETTNVTRSSFVIGSVVGNFGSFAGLNGSIAVSTSTSATDTNDEVRQIYTSATAGSFTLVFDTRDEHQSVYVADGATGMFTLKFRGQTTGEISVDASALEVQQALAQLTSIQTGNVLVTGEGTSVNPWDVHFVNILKGANVDELTSLRDDIKLIRQMLVERR